MKKKGSNIIVDFFKSEKNKLLHFVRKKVNNLMEIGHEDIVQDVMVKIFETLETDASIDSIEGYVYRSLNNRIIDKYRSKKDDLSIDGMISKENQCSLDDILSDLRYETHSEVERHHIKERIFEALETLNQDQKEVGVYTELEGFTFQELSEKLGIPIGTLLSRKHRAMCFLQKELSDIKDFLEK